MAAIVKVLTSAQWEILCSILEDATGVVVIPPDTALKMPFTTKEVRDLYLPEYHFYGEASVWLDIVYSVGHPVFMDIEQELSDSDD